MAMPDRAFHQPVDRGRDEIAEPRRQRHHVRLEERHLLVRKPAADWPTRATGDASVSG